MSQGTKKKILIVDDEPDLCEVLEFDLKDAGYDTMIAHSGNQALKIIKTQTIDAIVSDIHMPDGTGIELLDSVKSISPLKPVLLFITGHADLTVEEAYDKGAEGLFDKPVKIDRLLASLKNALTPPKERWSRSNPRISTNVAIELSVSDERGSIRANILNLGRGGAFIAMPSARFPELGAEVFFRINFGISDQIEIIEGSAIVRWRRAEDQQNLASGIGVEFHSLAEHCRENVLKLVDKVQKRSFIPKS